MNTGSTGTYFEGAPRASYQERRFMPDFVTLTCPSCGGQLEITTDVDRFACGYCGTEHLVKRGGGIVTLAPVVEGIKKVQVGVDKTASELALVRLAGEIHNINQELHKLDRQIQKEKDKLSPEDVAFMVILLIGWCSVTYVLGEIFPLTQYSMGGIGLTCLGGFLITFLLAAVIAVTANKLGIPTRTSDDSPKEARKAFLEQQLEQRHQEVARHRRILSE